MSSLIVRRGFSSAVARINRHPLMRWRFAAARTDRLVIAPQDLRTADATRAAEIYAGRFAFAGKIAVCDGRSPFDLVPPSDEWEAALLGFSWLRHLRAADSAISRANARALVDEWLSSRIRWTTIAARPDVLARRIQSWLCHSPMLLQDADMAFYRRFLRALARQVRYLRRSVGDLPDGIERIHAVAVLNYAALCMAGQARGLRSAQRRLAAELNRQILPDGGHVSRNPGALVEILLDLLPLRQTFVARNLQPPAALLNAIDRMMPMLRFFRHADGNLALFNGMGPTPADQLATVLSYDDTRGRLTSGAPHSGYQRLEAGGTTVIVDTGAPPPLEFSRDATAGCLSFEFSSSGQRIIVNCGLPLAGRENWREVARATAAQSTLTVADHSSLRFMASATGRRLLRGTPVVAGPAHVTLERHDEDEAIFLRGSHDGYGERFGVVHERALRISADGHELDGEDILIFTDGGRGAQHNTEDFAVRFHLHPAIKASRLNEAHSIMLVTPARESWTFTAHDAEAVLEESVFLAGNDGPRRTMQIVIHGRIGETDRIRWSLTRAAQAASSHPRRRAADPGPELPL